MAGPADWAPQRVGVYDVVERIGAGGMGEVYRARDARLGRDVAIKILPSQFTQDRDRLARFEREARVLAALNHPNIGAIYGFEEAVSADGSTATPALVLELIEGVTLAERIAPQRGLPIGEALKIAGQIANALEAAHDKGIVHRDLKPANIKITPAGTVKVLDFGLAKAAIDETPNADLSHSPTMTHEGTRAGMILGTAAYMSPEQARGKPLDARTDIWSFGCVLFEMLTGRAPFAKETLSDTIAAILERDPDWNALPRSTPAAVRALVRGCLDKDPGKRPQRIADVRPVLDGALIPAKRSLATAAWVAGAAAALALVAGVFWWTRAERDVLVDASRWTALTAFPDAATQPALSPDGRFVAFIHGPDTFTTPGQIYVKQLPNGEAIPLTNDDFQKMSPVFSADGTRIAYTTTGGDERWSTWIVPTLRGTPRRWLHNASGLTWLPSGQLLFAEFKPGTMLHMAIVIGDEARTTTTDVYVPSHNRGRAHRAASSPDGKSVLVVEMDELGVWMRCRLVPRAAAASARQVGPTVSRCTDVGWAPDGRYMYFSADAGDGFHLWQQRFPDGVPQQLTRGPTAEEGIAIAPDGGSVVTSVGFRKRGVWIHDAAGDRQISGEGYAFWPSFSRDGQKILYRRSQTPVSAQAASELWVTDIRTGQTDRLFPGQLISTYDVSSNDRIVAAVVEADGTSRLWRAWLDGREPPQRIANTDGNSPRFAADDVVFRTVEGNQSFLFRVDASGTARSKISPFGVHPTVGGTSPDGEWLSGFGTAVVNRDMWLFSTTGRHAPVRFLKTAGTAGMGRLRWRPDGRRAAFSVASTNASAFGMGRTYVIPLRDGSMLPDIPAGGFGSEAEIAALPGVEVIPFGDVMLGRSPGTYAFSRETVTRNLYRIPLR